MSRSRYFNLITGIVVTAAIIFTAVFTYAPEKLGISAKESGTPYGGIFDKLKVMDIEISADAEEWQEMLDNAIAEEYIPCDVTINGEKINTAGIRPKGNSSLTSVYNSDSDRYSFKIEFDHYVSGRYFNGLDKISLNNIFADSTYMKEYMAYDIFSYVGVETPLYSYAEIKVNGEVWGTYLAVEAMEDSYAQRVYGSAHGQLYKPESEMGAMPNMGALAGDAGREIRQALRDANFAEIFEQAGKAPDIGDWMAGRNAGGGGADLVYTGDDIENYSQIFDNAVFDNDDGDKRKLVAAIKALSEGDVEGSVNVDATLRYLAAQTFIINFDSYYGSLKHNYYLYEENGKLTMLPWDLNLAFGGFQTESADSAVNHPIDTPLSGVSMDERPMVSKFLENPVYLEKYHSYLNEIEKGYFDSGLFARTFSAAENLISPYVERDATKFYTYDEYKAGVKMLKAFLILRAESVKGQISGKIPSTANGQAENPSARINSDAIDLSVMGSQGGARGRGGIGGDFQGGQGMGRGRPHRQEKADGFWDGGALPQFEAGGALPQSEDGGMIPQFEDGGMLPQSEGDGMIPQSEDGGAESAVIIIISAAVIAAGIVFAARFRSKRYITK